MRWRKKRGGFTLVEVIVVLIILAILAAILIPALTGYIDKAQERQAVAAFHLMELAAKTAAAEVDLSKCKAVYVNMGSSGGTADELKMEALIAAYLDPDMKDQYVIMLRVGENKNFDFLGVDALYVYYPNGNGTTPYYDYNNGTITKH